MSSSGFFEITPARRNQLQQLFENGNKQMSLGGFDYATDMFKECVLGDPSNIIYLQSFVANLRKKYGEKKKKSVFSLFSSGGIKTAEMQKKWANVIKAGLDLLKSNPWDASAFASMGRACLELGYDEAGLAYLKHSIDCNPNDIEVNRVAARVLRDMKKFDDSIACWTRVKKLKPDDQEANRAIGDLMVEKTIHKGGYDGAESTKELKVVNSSGSQKKTSVPVDEDVMGRPLTFEEQIQRRLKKDPEDVVAYVELAEHYFQAS
ncbi:MAG: tetratricopeptide repeat protein, partial [Thermoguttaceae bacterium]